MQTEKRPDMVEARRRFLATCGRYALITPPVVTLLLSSTAQNYAVAGSGHGRRRRHSSNTIEDGSGGGAGDAGPREIAGTGLAQDDKRPA